ncbi:glycerophosphodiester phosphodiesterase family protein [Crocosphaera sp. Alani8]|uniref:glycerophosphodiester phosphodiesterase family protein n=1 Tax=Crocosphaera sp. Alani8 TaxID=3038952 RepID=UPI00313B2F0F
MAMIYGNLVNSFQRGSLNSSIGYGHLNDLENLQYISNTYATGIGVWKNNILPRISINPMGENSKIRTKLTGKVTSFVDNAHRAGLLVHCYTLRPEKYFLTLKKDDTVQTMAEEIEQLINIGVDGFFCDDPTICLRGSSKQ